MTRSKGGRPTSIRRKVVLLAAVIACVLTSSFAVIYFFTARADTLSGARIAAEESLARLQRELDLPLWNLDVETCKRIALGELNDPAVTAVLIRDIASGITFGVAESSASGKRIDVDAPTAAFLEDSAPIMVSGAVEHAMRVIGAAIVLADPRPALGTLLSGVLVATALAFLVGAAISASLYIAVDRIITVRLLALGSVLDRFAAGAGGARSGETGADDIGRLAVAFNAMADTISDRTGDLENRTEEVRLLLARVEGQREEERTRVARELHDELGQGVTGLGMALYLLERRLGELDGPAAAMMADMRSLLAELSEGMRRIIADLRPSVLDRLGLPQALARLAVESGERSGARVEFSCPSPEEIELPDEPKTALYRIAKEALTNALLHSGTARVRISLAASGGRTILEVEDEGSGFEPSPGPTKETRSFGIIGMRERCRAFGGDFFLRSSPGAGTLVRASLPLSGRSPDAHPDS